MKFISELCTLIRYEREWEKKEIFFFLPFQEKKVIYDIDLLHKLIESDLNDYIRLGKFFHNKNISGNI